MSEHYQPLCTVCDEPMVDGQAFNGLKRAHWDCAPGEPKATSILSSFVPMPSALVPPDVARKVDRPAPRAPEKGPTSENVRLASQFEDARKVESRPWVETWRRPVNGKSSIGLECPFCFEIIQAFVWSLPNGKRCTCGALHGRERSTHWAVPKAS